jgi:hypothetical protein
MKRLSYVVLSILFATTAYADRLTTTDYVKSGLSVKQDKITATPADAGKVLKIDATGNVILGTDNDTPVQVGDGVPGTVITNTGTLGAVGSLAIDATPTDGSDNLVTSNAVHDLVLTKQDRVAATAADEGRVLKIDAAGNVALGTDNDTPTDITGKQDLIGGGTAGTVITNTGSPGAVGSLGIDSVPTSGSANLATSGSTYQAYIDATNAARTYTDDTANAINASLGGKQDMVGNGTVDVLPTSASSNLVSSGGVYQAIATSESVTQAYADTVAATKQNQITASGSTNLLTAPDNLGDQPGTIPISSFATTAQGALADSAVQTVSVASGANNGTVKLTVNGTETDNIAVTGLGSAAYTESTAYAPAFVSQPDAASAQTYSASHPGVMVYVASP